MKLTSFEIKEIDFGRKYAVIVRFGANQVLRVFGHLDEPAHVALILRSMAESVDAMGQASRKPHEPAAHP